MLIGILTGGGDCPGLNAAIRAIVRAAAAKGHRVLGIREGWNGLLTAETQPLTVESTRDLLAMGGTVLGGSRRNPLKVRGGLKTCLKNFKKLRLDALISIGGEGTLNLAARFSDAGVPVVCVPKTIDNDTWGTDVTIGFDTAVQVATDAIDRLQTTAESHKRVMIVEVMGRHAGWIAVSAGLAGGADAILTPEEVFDLRDLLRIIRLRAKRRRHFNLFVVSEDAKIRLENGRILKTPLKRDEYGDVKLGGIGDLLAHELRRRKVPDVRVSVLGHIQRGGTPTAFDRILATRLGVYAVELVSRKNFGTLAVFRGNRLQAIPIREAAGRLKTVSPDLARVARIFFG